jgi:regulatory LuxR family protein
LQRFRDEVVALRGVGSAELGTLFGTRCPASGKEQRSRISAISAKTVEAHVSAVLRKLQLSSRHELSRSAMERGLVDP